MADQQFQEQSATMASDCKYIVLSDETSVITPESPERGSFSQQLQTLAKLALLEKGFSSRKADLLYAIVKYNPGDHALLTRACHAIVHLCRRHSSPKKNAHKLLQRGIVRLILCGLFELTAQGNNLRLHNGPEQSAELLELFCAICSALHSLCFHVAKGEILVGFSFTMQRDAIDMLVQIVDAKAGISSAERLPARAVTCAVWLLLNLCYVSTENQAYIGTSTSAIDWIAGAMMAHPNDTELQEKGSGALRNLADLAENRRVMCRGPACSIVQLLHAADSFQARQAILHAALGALRNLSLEIHGARRIAEAGGLDILMALFSTKARGSVAVAELCVELLENLAKDAETRRTSLEEHPEYLEKLLDLMEEHKFEMRVMVEGCGALGYMCLSPALELAISTGRGINTLLRAMKRFPHYVPLQQRCGEILLLLSGQERNHFRLISKHRALGRAITTMRMHEYDANIQAWGVGFLMNLCVRDACRDKVFRKGGLTRIIDAMSTLSEVEIIQERGCGALALLAGTPSFRGVLTHKGGLKRVLEAMRHFMENSRLHQSGADFLSNMALNAYCQIQIVAKGGVEVLCQSIVCHGRNPGVLERCCAAFWNLSVHSQNQLRIAARGGLDAIVYAMKSFLDVSTLQQSACGALRNLSLQADNQVRLRDNGGIDALLRVMETHSENIVVQQEGCGALVHLALNEDNREVLTDLQAFDVVVHAMSTHCFDIKVQNHGCGALLNISLCEITRGHLLSSGAVKTVLRAMERFHTVEVIQERGCRVLIHAASHHENRNAMSGMRCVDVARSAASNHPMSKSITTYAKQLHRLLSTSGYEEA